MSTWLVKADQREPEYLEIAPDLRGYAWTPRQSEAHRFTDRAEAKKVAEEHGAYVVRLKPKDAIDIDKAMAELIAMGHMETAGTSENGEQLYRLTKAGIASAETMIYGAPLDKCEESKG